MDKLGFGMMRLPYTDKKDNGSLDIPKINKMVDLFLEKGFTYFDTAWMYCNSKSENCVGETVVKRYDRSAFTVTDKLPDYPLKSEEDRDAVFNEQLRKTGAGYFDYYLLHAIDDENVDTFEKFHCFEWLLGKKESGLVKHCAFSFHGTPELLEKLIVKYPWIEYIQLQINYLDWDDPKIQSRACYEVCEKYDKQVIVMEPVKGGKLAKLPAPAEALLKQARPGLSPAAWAICFAASLKNVFMVLSGMSTLEQVAENCEVMRSLEPLTGSERKLLEKAASIIKESVFIPCTGCAYCLAKCPLTIQIPSLFNVYNEDRMEGTFSGKDAHIKQYLELKAASDPEQCLKCGACEAICPQHLKVREHLETVVSHFKERMES